MILRLALRSLLSRPIRSAVLAGGFGLGVSVMAALLGIGAVILDQAKAPALVGGGDVIVGGASGRVANAPFLLTDLLGTGELATRVKAAAPSSRTTLYLIDSQGATAIRARGGIPSLERALDDPETAPSAAWNDTPTDRAWAAPSRDEMLRRIDAFHSIPDVPERAGSWAEWLYFNGRSSSARFYLSFLAGARTSSGHRTLRVRLQLERGGRMRSYGTSVEMLDQELIASAPELTAGASRVRLQDGAYRISFDLPAESGSTRASGEVVVRGNPGASLPPYAIRGARGWVSGYVVPVLSGSIDGEIVVDGERLDLTGGTGYHDHNWGFWEGVSWQWGQVQGGGLSFVYGRIVPPADAVDRGAIPGFLTTIGPNGPIGFATDVTIDEHNGPGSDRPDRIVVRARSRSLSLTFHLSIEQTTVTQMGEGLFGGGLDFLQLRAQYHVSGFAGNTPVEFTAPGSAETFRRR